MVGFWEQVISAVLNAMEEGKGLFSMPTGPRRSGMPDLTTGLLGSTLRALDMAKGAPPPPQMMRMMNTRKQTALHQALGAMGGAVANGTTDRDNAFGSRVPGAGKEDGTHKSTFANPLVAPIQGLKPRLPQGIGGSTGCPANVKLFRFNPQGATSLIFGGLVSSKKGPKRFCISTHCGLAHNKKVFDRLVDGDYYIIESGGHGGVSGQPLRAFLEPSLPKVAAEYSPDNKEELEASNLMEGWLSLFHYLIEVEAQGDTRGPNPELASFASQARQSAFKCRSATTGPRDCATAPRERWMLRICHP
jgi:hypothetical protein